MTESNCENRRYLTPWTDSIVEILGVHLHRYLMPLLMDHQIPNVAVMVGFEASRMPAVVLRVSAYGAERIDTAADYAQMTAKARSREDIAAPMPCEMAQKSMTAFPILSISEPGREHIHAFVLTENEKLFTADILTVALRTRINEAIRSFRHNSLRMMFDECEGDSPREFLDKVLELIPVWCGSDHSACLILASSLESMVLSGVGPAHFQIVNEKLYCAPGDESKSYDNLSSLEFVVRHGESSGLIGHAFDEVRRTKSVGLNIFVADSEDEWFSMGEIQKSAHRVATNSFRPVEKLTVLLPLLCANEVGQQELLGFLSINFFETMPLASLTSRVLETLATRLGTYLHRSSFFSLSAQQLWLLECVREEQIATARLFKKAGGASTDDILETFVKNINQLMAQATQIPCFAIGYRRQNADQSDTLRFTAPHGFTNFTKLDIPIYTDHLSGSSLAALAVRLNRAITLTGGETKSGRVDFQSTIYVNEASGTLADSRLTDIGTGFTKLSDYYRPTGNGSYAALCYPIRMQDDVVGIIAVEVNRDTNWVWWTGFGSYLFYRLLANELAADFRLLGLDFHEND